MHQSNALPFDVELKISKHVDMISQLNLIYTKHVIDAIVFLLTMEVSPLGP